MDESALNTGELLMRTGLRYAALVTALVLSLQAASHAQWMWTKETGRFVKASRLPKETPELQIEYARGLLVEGEYRDALRETSKFEEYYYDSPEAAENQFLRGEIRMAQGKEMKALQEFQLVLSNYPDSPLYEKVIRKEYELGDLLYERGLKKLNRRFSWFRRQPLSDAITTYNTVIENQPFTTTAAEAQYKVGLCHVKQKQYIEAAYEYRRVIEDYATSDWVDDASYGLAECYAEASNDPPYDQTPSLLAIQAIDGFCERYPRDERCGELKARRVEMVEKVAQQRLGTAKFYEKRRRFEAARIYYNEVADQFPGTQAASEAEAWIAANGGATAQ
jgi:outer membrane assembly lipoprotein YfiO